MSGQIDILRRELLTICDDGTSQCDSVVASVRLLIIRHQRIITLSDNIEELYSDIVDAVPVEYRRYLLHWIHHLRRKSYR